MAILAKQHQPGGWKFENEPHSLGCAWPGDCTVQWGTNGLVFPGRDGNPYTTAFFEAFPRDPVTFIRGEGETVAEAEASAFRQFERLRSCPGHEFAKRGYRNGAGICRHCGMFRSKAFEPWEPCARCGRLTYYHWEGDKVFCEEHIPEEMKRQMDQIKRMFNGEGRDAKTEGEGDELRETPPGGCKV